MSLIPNILYQVGTNISTYSKEWIANNHDYRFMLLDDAKCDHIVSMTNNNVINSYKRVKLGVMKADICRLAILSVSGGVYADLDVKPYKSLRYAIPRDATLVSSEYYSFEFMAAIPHHPFIDFALNETSRRIDEEIDRCNRDHICCRGHMHV